MSTEHWTRVMSLLDRVLQQPEEEQIAFLNEVCDDPALRDEVETLLLIGGEPMSFLDQGAAALGASLLDDAPPSSSSPDHSGAHVGPYRLVERIGTGGMSVVYRAERADGHYDHDVAIKLLPQHFETEHRVARFETERQILARLSHPNIAQLLDGGVTETGQPYLVMEYVDGIPITEYCTTRACTLNERLHLLRTVCQALHHAHQNLVVHRDLKPENILVTDTGRVMLLDFGIAKLLQPELHAQPCALTRTGERPMTPGYAAPEQIKGDAITTATDIYQLGVLAYHVLTNTHPFKDAGSEIQQAILNTSPPPPSSVIAKTTNNESSSDATTECPRHSKMDRDLDTIILKALRKEPDRRYHSAQELANDFDRYLNDLPIQAKPATLRYRTHKFVQRNRRSLLAASIVVFFFVGFSLFHVHRLSTERDTAQQHAETAEAVTAFMTDLIEMGDPAETRGSTISPEDLLDHGLARVYDIQDQPRVEAQIRLTLGRVYRRLGNYAQARPLIERALALQREHGPPNHPDHAEALKQKGALLAAVDEFEAAADVLQRSLSIWNHHGQSRALDRVRTQHRLAYVLRRQGYYRRSEALHHNNVQTRQAMLGASHPETLQSQKRLGITLHNQGKYDAAETMYRQAVRGQREVLDAPHPQLAVSLNSLGALYMNQGRFQEAEPLLREALGMRRALFGETHETVALTMNNLAMTLRDRGALNAAESLFEETLSIRRTQSDNPRTGTAMTLRELATLLVYNDRLAAAQDAFEEALSIFKETLQANHSFVVRTQLDLAYVRSALHGNDQAASEAEEAFARIQEIHPDSSLERGLANIHKGAIAAHQNRFTEADSLLTAGADILTSMNTSPRPLSQRQQYAHEHVQQLQRLRTNSETQ